MTIGILGGGQLGYMLALAGYPLGLHFRFLDPSPEAPVGRIANRVTADFGDRQALEKFSHGLEVVTYEFENVPVAAAKFLAGRAPVYPPAVALEEAQDRLREKRLFRRLEIPVEMQKNNQFAPLGAPDGLVKSAILGGNSGRLYRVDVKSAQNAITTDKIAAIRAEYVAAGGERSNARYGYVARATA